MADKNCMK